MDDRRMSNKSKASGLSKGSGLSYESSQVRRSSEATDLSRGSSTYSFVPRKANNFLKVCVVYVVLCILANAHVRQQLPQVRE
jgi:hypothetical protein